MPRSAVLQLPLVACLLVPGAGSAVAQPQQPADMGPSFEASLKKLCPTRNLEFLPVATLAQTTDAFVAQLAPEVREQARTLSQPGVQACQGNADESCRTAAILGTLRYLRLSEPLAQRFCGLAMTCTDWFQCHPDGPAEATREARADSPVEVPSPAEPPAPQAVPPSGPAPAPALPDDVEARAGATAERPGAQDKPPLPRRAPEVPARAAQPLDASFAPPATPEDAVRGFYEALGRRDGIAAASFLIPPKRGRGNYSAAAMQRFYGGLARPLVLRDVRPIGPLTVAARYDFTTRDSAVCDGRSIVSLRASEEGVLISSIRALSNC